MKFVVILSLCAFLVIFNRVDATTAKSHEEKGGVSSAGGKHEEGNKSSEFKHVESGAKKSVHDVEKSKKGESLKELHKKDHEEKGGKKKTYGSSGGHKSGKSSGGASEHGAKFQEGKKLKKLNYKKGFREKYHKDEHKKHDSFYSNGNKKRNYEHFGQKHSRYNKHQQVKKHFDNHKVGKDENDYRKMWLKLGGHNHADNKAHKGEKATKSHNNHQEKYAKKGGKSGGKQYKYKARPHK